jgi:hypothetical protein
MIRAALLAHWTSDGARCDGLRVRRLEFEGPGSPRARWTCCNAKTYGCSCAIADGEVYGTFSRLEADLPEGQTLGLAMNAGMFHEDLRPVGLYVEDGAQEMRLVTRDGPGNFGLLPNGVLCISDAGADVIESLRFADKAPDRAVSRRSRARCW